MADPRPGPGPKPAGPTGPQPTHPPSMPPPAPVPAKTSNDVPSVCEPSGHGAPSGTRAAQPYLRGAGCAAHQTPAAVVGSGGGGT
jgi:hypothetical protein